MSPIPVPIHELQYRALGLIRGILHPMQGSTTQGVLVAADGTEYPATPGRATLLRKFAFCMETDHSHWFYVQPQPRPGGTLGMSIIKILSLSEAELEQEGTYSDDSDIFPPAPDDIEEGFNIRGNIEVGKGSLAVTIKRKPQGNKQFPPLLLQVQGFLPGVSNGEFWELFADREGHDLVLVDGNRLLPAA